MQPKANKKEETKNTPGWLQIIIIVVSGAILGIGATLFTLYGKIERLDEQVTNIKEQLKTKTGIDQPITGGDSITKVEPDQLSILIRSKQSQNVKISKNETDCFTIEDLAAFKQKRKQDQVVNELLNENSFIDLVISIKDMSASSRQTLLEASKKIAKQTWGELGTITSKGQTDAGQEAELLIADAIVTKINEMIKLPVEELKKKYK